MTEEKTLSELARGIIKPMLAEQQTNSENEITRIAGDAWARNRYFSSWNLRRIVEVYAKELEARALLTFQSLQRVIETTGAPPSDRLADDLKLEVSNYLPPELPAFITKTIHGISKRLGPGYEQKNRSFLSQARERALIRVGAEIDLFVAGLKRDKESPELGADANVFRKVGDRWQVIFEKEPIILNDIKGVKYLAHLLRNPGKEIHALELIRIVEGNHTSLEDTPRISLEEALDNDLTISARKNVNGGMEIIDRKYLNQVKEQLRDIEEELQEARRNNDMGRIPNLKHKKEEFCRLVSGAIGLGNRLRRTADFSEKARQSVSRNIRRALEHIETRHPDLYEHLKATVKTGQILSYKPQSPTCWHF